MSWLGVAFGDTGSCQGDHLGEDLGDVICTEGDCKEGEALIQQMLTFWEKVGSPARFKPAVDSLLASYNAARDKFSRQIPFSPVCCEIKGIGKQAEQLVSQMAVDAGVAAPPVFVPSESFASKIVQGVVIAAVVGIGGTMVVNAWSKRNTGTSSSGRRRRWSKRNTGGRYASLGR